MIIKKHILNTKENAYQTKNITEMILQDQEKKKRILTSLNPCAAPDRSTLLLSDLSVSNSQGTSSGKFSSPIPLIRDPRALAATDLTSGIGSTRTYFSMTIKSPTQRIAIMSLMQNKKKNLFHFWK